MLEGLPKATAFKPPDLLRGILTARTRIQAVGVGLALRPISGISEATAAQWYKVTFDKPFLYKPTVVANAEVREGTWPTGRMELPKFSVPDFPLPSSIVPTWPTVSIANVIGEASYATWRKFFERIDEKQTQFFRYSGLFPIGGKEMAALMSKLVWAVFDLLKEDFWLLGGRPGAEVEKIVNQVIPGRMKEYSDRLQASFQEYGSKYAAAFKAYHNDVVAEMDNLKKLAENAMNSALPQLYDHIGLPSNIKISPVNIRNVTTTGFEFLGVSGPLTVHWVAFGLVQSGEEGPPTKPIQPEKPTFPIPALPGLPKLPSRPPFPWE